MQLLIVKELISDELDQIDTFFTKEESNIFNGRHHAVDRGVVNASRMESNVMQLSVILDGDKVSSLDRDRKGLAFSTLCNHHNLFTKFDCGLWSEWIGVSILGNGGKETRDDGVDISPRERNRGLPFMQSIRGESFLRRCYSMGQELLHSVFIFEKPPK